MRLHTTVFGSGSRVVFVHGTMTSSGQAWKKQRALGNRWTVVLIDRRGYEPNPPADRSDFEDDGGDIASMLEPGDHVVGHSYGALGAMFAASLRPDVVRSLTTIEPPVLGLVRGDPAVEQQIEAFSALRKDVVDPREFHIAFAKRLGAPVGSVANPLPAPLERLIRLLMNERPPWEAAPPLDVIRASAVRTLTVSGGWDPIQEAISDALFQQLGTFAERAVITGRGHVAQRTGALFNDRLEELLTRAEAG
jgi:pimeloyl-ACP methyl ester carboxylesterase